jgi:6-phosphofructokinase 1
MPVVVRESDVPYRWTIGKVELVRVANVVRKMPKSYISKDGYGITAKGKRYLAPLIVGEDYPPYRDGLPQYVTLNNELVPKKLEPFDL